MQISEKDLKEYKHLYKKEHGIDLSNKKAFDKALRLVNLMRIVYLPPNNYDKKIKPKWNK